MYLSSTNRESSKYPTNRLLKLRGKVPDREMHQPIMLDPNNDPCLIVLKRGSATGLNIGRANNIHSYKRNYYNSSDTKTSKELISGLLTGSNSPTDSSDITYSTLISFILTCLKANGFKANINPSLDA